MEAFTDSCSGNGGYEIRAANFHIVRIAPSKGKTPTPRRRFMYGWVRIRRCSVEDGSPRTVNKVPGGCRQCSDAFLAGSLEQILG